MAVELKKLVDLRIDTAANVRAIHDVVKGGANIVNQTFQSVSTSNSNLDFVIQTPGLGVYASRRVNVLATLKLRAVFTNTTGADLTFTWGRNIGCPAFPFNSLISSATVQINTSSFNTQVQQTLPLIKRMCQSDGVQDALTDCASGMGQSAIIYQPGDGAPTDGLTGTPIGSGFLQSSVSANPFDFYKGGNPSSVVFTIPNTVAGTGVGTNVLVPASGSGQTFTVVTGTTTEAQGFVDFTLTVYEPLLCQPFLVDDEEPAFINTNLISVRLNLTAPDAELARIVRIAYRALPLPAAGSAFGMSALRWRDNMDTARVLCTFITPPAVDQIPTKCIYPTTFYNPLLTSFRSTPILASSSRSAWDASNVLTLNTAPDALAIYAIPVLPNWNDGSNGTGGNGVLNPGVKGAMLEDLCLSIDKIDITWNNNPSLLVTLDKRELWRRTKQNGMPISWPVFNGVAPDSVLSRHTANTLSTPPVADTYDVPTRRALIGSPVLLALNKDIPVEPGVGAGVAGVYTLVVKVNLTNQFPFDISGYDLYVVPINSQYLVLNSGATSDLINTVATEAVVAATQVTGDVQSKPLLGGSRTGDSHIMAHFRGMNPASHLLDMGARAIQSLPGASAAANLVASKRGRFDYT